MKIINKIIWCPRCKTIHNMVFEKLDTNDISSKTWSHSGNCTNRKNGPVLIKLIDNKIVDKWPLE